MERQTGVVDRLGVKFGIGALEACPMNQIGA
jgi:hypothetical protein